MASSSSVASDLQYLPPWKYDVFLSFRGADTRRTIMGHVYEALKNRGIYTFQDDKRLEEGNSIPDELLKAIEGSQVALIIFSENFAASSWCLNEVAKIMECKEKNGQTVIPIFYGVDPSHVRYQSESFAAAFEKHELRFKDDVDGMRKVRGWRTALTDVANLKGHDFRDGSESEKIQEIVDHISFKFCKSARSLYFLQDVVGINAHLEKVKSLLQIEINDVRFLGIWGIGGVGKTTIAKALSDTLYYQFQSACFLADVKENARKNGLHSLQNTLLSELLRKKEDYVNNKHDGKSTIPSRLYSMKVLIVLDDIDHGDHLEYLAGDVGWFGSGSRVIVTTRNRHLIGKDDAIYEVSTLPDHEAMQLFNKHAFKKEVPNEHFKEFSKKVVNHAKGLPLALKVWGSLLHKKDLTQWRRTVDHIKKNSNLEIVEQLKISYDGLKPEEQTIFLDIACFFRGDERTEVMKILGSCGFDPEYILDVLIDKSLVFISKDKWIEMHDLIEDMGNYVVKMQKDSGKPTRLWKDEDFEDVMVNNVGTEAVEVFWDDSMEPRLSKKAMKNMQRLRILHILNPITVYQDENDGSIECMPNNLRWVNWQQYPWQVLPQNFNPIWLVHFQFEWSSLCHLWNETKHLPYLQRLDLTASQHMKRTPDFTGMPNLKYLDLGFCTSLKKVHRSLKFSRKLVELNLYGCEKLKRFPYVNVESLKSLNLEGCSSLEKLPEFLTEPNLEIEIMKLNLEIVISRFHGCDEVNNIHLQPHLTELDWSGIDVLVALPSFICKLKCLVKLDVSRCSALECLPEEIADLENLEVLDASDTLISRPPSSIFRLNKLKVLTFRKEEPEHVAHFVFPEVNEGLLSLEQLDLSCCNITDGGLPEDIGCLFSLKKLNLCGNNFEHLPGSIAQLGALQSLDLSSCEELEEFPDFTGMTNLDTLDLSYCYSIDEGLLEDIGCLSSLKVLNLSGNYFEHLPLSIGQLGALQSLDLSYCGELKELLGFTGMPNLDTLDLSYCNLIDGGLPEDIGCLSFLKELNLSRNNFEYLPQSIAQLGALRTLDLSHCIKLKEFPDFTGMTNFNTLDLSYCKLIDGGLLKDIGCLSSLKVLNLRENNFEHLPRSIAKLGALQSLDLSHCIKLKKIPCFRGMTNLDTLDISYCNLIEGLPEDIGSLSSLKELNLKENNFEHLPQT